LRNNGKQRRNGKLLGGVTGRGFLPGRSGNPNGRPPTRGLVNSLKVKITEVGQDGRSVEDLLVDALLREAFGGRNRMAALAYIFDRLEGRPRQALDIKSIQDDIHGRSDEELHFYLENGRWPNPAELATLQRNENGVM
jgi:hypothetical protein